MVLRDAVEVKCISCLGLFSMLPLSIHFSELIAQRQAKRILSEKKLQLGRIKHQKAVMLQHILISLHEVIDSGI